MRLALGLCLLAVPSFAAASPFTVGVTLGETHSEAAANDGEGPSSTLGLYGRVMLTPRLSFQAELERIDLPDSTTARSGGGLLVIDLGSDRHLVPLFEAGIGLDHGSSAYGGDLQAHHIEAGLGLEYRCDGGLVIGVAARIGDRTLESQTTFDRGGGTIALYEPSTLRDGEYRSLRATAGVRF